MWQAATLASYREIAQRIAELATSKYISALVVNAGGTGYVTGDVLQITHAGATMPSTFVITASAGAVTAIQRIVNGGAFSNRVATVTKNAGGSGYAVNDIVRLTTGTFTQAAKAKVTAISAGAVTTVALFEGGGAYSSVPTATGGATNSDIGTGTGSGLTVDTTMTGLVGTTGIASTAVTGVGTGATFNLTLTDTGWTMRDDRNDYSINGVLDEKEMILEGSVGAGEDTPIVGIRTGTNSSGVTLRHFLSFTAFTAWNVGLAYDVHPNAINPAPTTTAGQLIGVIPTDSTIACWFSITARKLNGFVRADGGTVTSYHHFYDGLGNPFGTATENPYPMLCMASVSGVAIAADSSTGVDISGLTECFSHNARNGPAYAWIQNTVSWAQLVNGDGTGAPPFTARTAHGVAPIFQTPQQATLNETDLIEDDGTIPYHAAIGRNTGVASTFQIKPTPDTGGDLWHIVPATVIFGTELNNQCELANVFWLSAVKSNGTLLAPEDTLTIGTDVYRVFPNGSRTETYSFLCVKEGA